MLSVDLHPIFTLEVLEKLKSHKIKTLLDFVQHNNDKIAVLMGCSVSDVIKIKDIILSLNASKAIRGHSWFKDGLKNTGIVPVGISEIDNCLGGGLSSGSITEIYGHSNSGKSKIALHLAAHASANSQPVAYFSTSDLNAIEIFKGISHLPKEVNEKEVLQRISFGHVADIYELFDLLWHPEMERFKVVVIDSLATLFQPILGDSNNDAISLLNKVASDLKRLAITNHCVVLIINQMCSWQKDSPALGRYWLHVPHLRLYSQRISIDRFQLSVVHNVHDPSSNNRCTFSLPTGHDPKTSHEDNTSR